MLNSLGFRKLEEHGAVPPGSPGGALILCFPWAGMPRPEASWVTWKTFFRTVNLVSSGFIMKRDFPLACSLVSAHIPALLWDLLGGPYCRPTPFLTPNHGQHLLPAF